MALKPTIYKLRITLADIDRSYYDSLNLTIAQHPSETLERMMARVLAYCINAQEHLVFTQGVCAATEPDMWARTLDDQISLWIEVGEPSVDKIRKATRLSPAVKVYTFNRKSNTWWDQGRAKIERLNASVYRFDWQSMKALAAMVKRSMDLTVTITDDMAYIADKDGSCEVSWVSLRDL